MVPDKNLDLHKGQKNTGKIKWMERESLFFLLVENFTLRHTCFQSVTLYCGVICHEEVKMCNRKTILSDEDRHLVWKVGGFQLKGAYGKLEIHWKNTP